MMLHSLAWTVTNVGFAKVDPLLVDDAEEALAYLKSRPVYPGNHVLSNTGAPGPWEQHVEANVVCWHMHDAILAPHLWERALGLTPVAAQYLETSTPWLYSINAFCTRPGQPVRPDIQDWHRDSDDVKFLPLFCYLTDVGEDGAQQLRAPSGDLSITGPVGTTFFSNTMLEHRGLKPIHEERIVWWARWGVSPEPASYVWDKLEPLPKERLGDRYPKDPWLQNSIRLVAR